MRFLYPQPVAFMPAPPAPSTSGVRLFIEGVRFDALAFSPAGVTVPRTVLELHPEMRRGAPCPATLQIGGEMFGVILRLASKQEDRVEFAFVSLAPQARRALEREAAAAPPPRTLDLAFARLVNAVVPEGRRVVLPESTRLYALTVARRQSRVSTTVGADAAPAPPSEAVALRRRDALPVAALVLLALAFVAVWAGFWLSV